MAVPAVLASTHESFRYFNSSPEVIRLVVMMYVRYPLSLRNVEDLLADQPRDRPVLVEPVWPDVRRRDPQETRRAHARLSAVALMEWMPPPDGIAMCQGGDVCRIPRNEEGIYERS